MLVVLCGSFTEADTESTRSSSDGISAAIVMCERIRQLIFQDNLCFPALLPGMWIPDRRIVGVTNWNMTLQDTRSKAQLQVQEN